MGYDVHITRKNNWFDDEGDEITLSEWLAYLHADPEMRLDGFAGAKLADGAVLRAVNPSMAVWVQHPQHGNHEGMAWIWLSSGNIQAKNPDEHTLRKMWQIAQKLGARVQGDEDEFYDATGSIVAEKKSELLLKSNEKHWWQFWR
jgi:hypothetical protein